MPSLRWTEVDVRALLSQADSFLRQSTAQQDQRALVRQYAFSAEQPGSSRCEEHPVDAAFVAGMTQKERQSPAMTSFARALWQDLGTDSPFFRDWFGESKVVDGKGEPLTVYHGTNAEFGCVRSQRAPGKATNHLTANLGIFFDANKSKAEHYARIASN
jgi:hypothetical protein